MFRRPAPGNVPTQFQRRASLNSLTRTLAACVVAGGALAAGTTTGLAQSPAPTPPATQGTPSGPAEATSPSELQGSPPAGGQTASPRNVERKTTGRPATDIRVGVFINVKNDCTSGPLPTIRLAEPPTRGKVQVKSGKISAKNYKTCLTLEVPAHIAFYRSDAGTVSSRASRMQSLSPKCRVSSC